MRKNNTIREQIAVLRTENLAQTEKIDRLIDTMDKHEESSIKFREQVLTNTKDINSIEKKSLPFLKNAIYALYGLLGSILIVVVVYFLNK